MDEKLVEYAWFGFTSSPEFCILRVRAMPKELKLANRLREMLDFRNYVNVK